mgnify:FL=1
MKLLYAYSARLSEINLETYALVTLVKTVSRGRRIQPALTLEFDVNNVGNYLLGTKPCSYRFALGENELSELSFASKD